MLEFNNWIHLRGIMMRYLISCAFCVQIVVCTQTTGITDSMYQVLSSKIDAINLEMAMIRKEQIQTNQELSEARAEIKTLQENMTLHLPDATAGASLSQIKTDVGLVRSDVGLVRSDLNTLIATVEILDDTQANLIAELSAFNFDVIDDLAATQKGNNVTISELVSKVQTLERPVANLVSERASVGTGSTYVRWGRTICPKNGSELLYAGYMAGTYFKAHPASGGTYLCLPNIPSWNHYSDTEDNNIKVTGVEFSMSPHHRSDISDFFGSNIRGQMAQCSVCRSVRSQVMIPGRSGCYDGWTIEYTGYLAAASPGYNDATEFVCLDLRPEQSGHASVLNGKNHLYLVEANSRFGLDDSYQNGREIACVVCSI